MYKSRLQELCQQKLRRLPEYAVAKVGHDHNPRFRASVTVDGLTFDGRDCFKSSKEAQNEAARLAFLHFQSDALDGRVELSDGVGGRSSGNHLVDEEFGGIQYKNPLQMFAQRRNMGLPLYDYTRGGSPHALRFKATVTVGGLTFESSEFYNTLKEAENAAAKAALTLLSPEGTQEAKVEGETFDGEGAKTKKLAEANAAKVAWTTLNKRKDQQDNSFCRIAEIDKLSVSLSTMSLPKDRESDSSDCILAQRDPLLLKPSPSNLTECTNVSVTAPKTDTSTEKTTCSLLCDRICVYPHIPDMQFPEGVTLLPFGDNSWVAVSLDYANIVG
ncbi:Double-stranded RNA-binding protein 1 [Acorus gramineus]|uniref:Double-stranded RNA-binding protein 1 n=1 Tax=Acorus gramineus TaxID=55184 RepID=A0AAV9AG22_ACOGR|nr:Double-stranded RNA-binding protein 1 [Acorus gramineus]